MRFAAALLALSLVADQAATTSWTGRGGNAGDFRAATTQTLTESFGDWGPRPLWRRALGDGYSAILAQGERLYVQYREQGEEILAALSAQDGKTIWEYRYAVTLYPEMDRNYGEGPNATPLLRGGRMFAASIDGQFHAVDVARGELVWRVDLHERYGRQKRNEEYGFSASPLEVNGRLIVLVGGEKHGVVALDPTDGSHVWGSPPSRISYAQATVIELDEGPQLVFFSPTAAIGMNALTGEFCWSYPVENMFQNNLTPALDLGERHVWIASQLDGGTRVLRIPRPGSDGKPEVLWENPRIKQAHWDSFREGDFIFGSLGGNSGSVLAGINWMTGEVAWKHRGFHLAKGVLAQGKFYFLDENGQLGIARFSPKGIEVLDSGQLLERVSWTPPTIIGQVLYARDRKHIVAVDLAPETYGSED